MGEVRIVPVTGIPEVTPGEDVAALIGDAIDAMAFRLADGDVVVVTHKIVSKAEGRIVVLEDDSPDAHRHLVEEESMEVLRRRGRLVISRTRHGFICANAGVDRSNAGTGRAVLLPIDPDASANRIRIRLARRFEANIAVIVSDTFGRVWRRGLTDVAIGVAGMEPITDLRGSTDAHGMNLEVTEVATADEIAGAADLVMGKAAQIPVAVVRGTEWLPGTSGAVSMVRPPEEDLFL
jgi:coenzyme F420-0:L-glutamate ligase/coenzyme F420-1:gamma-L-glutamate ligase